MKTSSTPKSSSPSFLSIALVAASLLMGLSACDSADSDSAVPTTVTFRIATGSLAKSASHVVVEEAKILVRELEFERIDNDSDSNNESEDTDVDFQEEFEVGPFVVSLDPQASTTSVFAGEIPEGIYDEIEFEIHKPEDTEPIPDPEFRDGTSGDERYSVIVRGTMEGQPFEVKARSSMEQELELAQPLVVDAATQSVDVDITVDVASWFVDSDGGDLDPTNATHLSEIENAIQRSFEGSGHDDDEDN